MDGLTPVHIQASLTELREIVEMHCFLNPRDGQGGNSKTTIKIPRVHVGNSQRINKNYFKKRNLHKLL